MDTNNVDKSFQNFPVKMEEAIKNVSYNNIYKLFNKKK